MDKPETTPQPADEAGNVIAPPTENGQQDDSVTGSPVADSAPPSPVLKANEGGGSTLSPTASAPAPFLTIEVYKDGDGPFRTNLTARGFTHPQHSSDSADEVRGAVDEFLSEKLAA